jgi:RNA polymerase sigma-70 factor (ECF subfamily)
MREEDSAAQLLSRWRAGDSQAAEMIFVRYAQRLCRLAEQRLSHRLAGRVDGDDVVQSVFRTFFRRSAAGEFRIASADQLWALLVQITLRKAQDQGRRHTADRRDVGLEMPAADRTSPETLARDPGPEEAAALLDQIEVLLRGLPDLHCHVLELRLQGHEVAAIASQLKVSRQTVYRVLHVLQQRLGRSAAEGDDPKKK